MPVEHQDQIEQMRQCPLRSGSLDITPSDDGYIIYQPDQDRVHYLNATAALILEFCDGRRSQAELADLVKDAYGLPESPVQVVDDAVAQMKSSGLLIDPQD